MTLIDNLFQARRVHPEKTVNTAHLQLACTACRRRTIQVHTITGRRHKSQVFVQLIDSNCFQTFSSLSVASSNFKKPRTIVVKEEDNLRLQCAATGVPPPQISWERVDGRVIDWGKWKDNSKVGQSINITKINRVHMGTYVCIADNAVPPSAKFQFNVEVHCKLIEFSRVQVDFYSNFSQALRSN